MERIHTRIVIKIGSGEVLEDRFYLYDGPLAMCGDDPGGDFGGWGDDDDYGAANVGGYGYDPNTGTYNYGTSNIGSPTALGGSFLEQPGVNLPGSFIDPVQQTLPGSFNQPSSPGLPAPTEPNIGMRWGPIIENVLKMKPFSAIGTAINQATQIQDIKAHLAESFPEMFTLTPQGTFTDAAGNPISDADVMAGAEGDSGGGAVGTGTNTTGGGGSMAPSSGGTTPGGPTSLAEMALDLYRRTDPARQSIIDRGTSFLEGGLDVTQSPMWGSGKNAAETQYRLARDATMANLPQGGALQSSLATGETDKARTLTDLASRIGMDEYSKIYGLASGAPQQSMAGMGVAGQTSATLAGQQMYQNVQEDAQKNQLYGDLGSGVGEAFGDK